MKNVLQYYYGINTNRIHQKGKQYFFTIDKENYAFIPIDRSLEEAKIIYELNKTLLSKKIYSHEIIANNTGQIITFVNQIPYALLKTRVKNDDVIILNDIIYFQVNTKLSQDYTILNRANWYQLWTTKIDYFEYQVSQLSKKYPRVQESFSYFVGLAEASIALFKVLNKEKKDAYCISHKRVNYKETLFELYNPFNYIIDIVPRDASEYFKSSFLDKEDVINDIVYYIQYSKLTEYELQMFFVRMLFPTFYFDVYEEVITGDMKEKELLKIIAHTERYEILLKQLYQYLRSIIYLPEIEWLNPATNYY